MVKTTNRPLPHSMPFNETVEVGALAGRGKDNVVYEMDQAQPGVDWQQHRRVPTGRVVKINRSYQGDGVDLTATDMEKARARVRYKKEKYELLKMFLGEFIPETEFVLGRVNTGGGDRLAEYTIQDELPRVKLSDLDPSQKTDQRLGQNLQTLLNRLRYMYKTLGEVNARTGHGVALDGKLDLGGISDYVVAEDFDHEFGPDDARYIIDTNKSPNLLVDPQTMMPYCIDFDEGEWLPGMTEAKALTERLIKRDAERGQVLGMVALRNLEVAA